MANRTGAAMVSVYNFLRGQAETFLDETLRDVPNLLPETATGTETTATGYLRVSTLSYLGLTALVAAVVLGKVLEYVG